MVGASARPAQSGVLASLPGRLRSRVSPPRAPGPCFTRAVLHTKLCSARLYAAPMASYNAGQHPLQLHGRAWPCVLCTFNISS